MQIIAQSVVVGHPTLREISWRRCYQSDGETERDNVKVELLADTEDAGASVRGAESIFDRKC